jgi:hypothetical protein
LHGIERPLDSQRRAFVGQPDTVEVDANYFSSKSNRHHPGKHQPSFGPPIRIQRSLKAHASTN